MGIDRWWRRYTHFKLEKLRTQQNILSVCYDYAYSYAPLHDRRLVPLNGNIRTNLCIGKNMDARDAHGGHDEDSGKCDPAELAD